MTYMDVDTATTGHDSNWVWNMETPYPMNLCVHRDYVDGEFILPQVELDNWLVNPNTGKRICIQRATDDPVLHTAVNAAWLLHKKGIIFGFSHI